MTEGSCRRAAALTALALLAGCAGVPVPEPATTAADWPARRAALLALEDWQLEGRVALSAGGDGWNGTLTWRQTGDALDFRLRGPLGMGGFRIHGDDTRLDVETTNGNAFSLSDPEAELRREFGWSVPVRSMRYWMLGVADPGAAAAEVVDGSGLLVELEQEGYVVRYESYRRVDDGLLPRKLVVEGDEVRIRMAVDRWTIHN